MGEKKVTIRMVMEGGKVVEAELLGIGKTGVGALGQVDAAAQRVSKTTGAMRGNVQNAAFQVQDFFVQVSGGTSPTRALSQQLPQLLGSMGLVGVLAGTAAAALIPMIGLLFDTSDPVKELTKDLDALNQAMTALKSADRAAGTSIGDLEKDYGRYAEQAKQVLEIQRQIAELNATKAFAGAASAIPAAIDATGGLAGMGSGDLATLANQVANAREQYALLTAQMAKAESGAASFSDEELENMRIQSSAAEQLLYDNAEYLRSIKDLAATFGVTEAAAAQLAVTAAKVGEADTTEERLAAAEALAKQIWESSDGLTNASDETIKLYNSLLDAVSAGLDLAALDLVSGFRNARIEAELLAAAMNFSAPDANGRIVDRSTLYANMGGRGLPADGTNYGIPPPPKKTRGGGGSAQTDQMREAKQLYEETRTEAERFAIEQQKIDLLFQTGSIDADTYQRAIEMIEKKYRDGGDATKYFGDLTASLEDAFIDLAITGEASFDAIAQAIQRALLQAALFGNGPLGSMFGGGVFGGISGLGGDLFANIAGARANGGPVMAGLSYLVGERGPELYTPSASGQIHKAGSFGGGASGGTTVQIIDQRSGGQAVQAETKTGPDGREIIVMTIRDATQRGELDKAHGRFGGKPKGIKR